MAAPEPLHAWHRIVESREPAALADWLAPEVVFCSPALHTPQEGREATTAYLTAAMEVLGPTLTYRHEWYDETSAVLEFTARIDGLDVHGVDMIEWDDSGRCVRFTVMVRPFKGLTTLMESMAARLS